MKMDQNPTVDHYSIQWQGFHSNIIRALEDLLSVEEFVDVTLSCEGKTFKGHKVILSAGSTYFRKILKENPCRHPVLILNDIQVDILDYLMTYIYHGTVSIPHDKLQEFLRSAEAFKIKGIVDAFKPINAYKDNCERGDNVTAAALPQDPLVAAELLKKESDSFDTSSSSSHPDDLSLLASAATTTEFSKRVLDNKSASEVLSDANHSDSTKSATMNSVNNLPPLKTSSPVNTTLTNHSTATGLTNHSTANALTNHTTASGLTNHSTASGLTNHSMESGLTNEQATNRMETLPLASAIIAATATASASATLTASASAIIAATASKRRKTMPRKLGSFMSSPARTPFSSGEEDSCAGDTEKENMKVDASLSTNKLNNSTHIREWLPGVPGLNIAGLIKQEQDINKTSSVNNNELASDLVNNSYGGNASTDSVDEDRVNNRTSTVRNDQGIRTSTMLNDQGIRTSSTLNDQGIRTSTVLIDQGIRDGEEKAMNLSTTSPDTTSQQEERAKKQIFCLQSGQSTTNNTTNSSMVSQAMQQLLPSQLLNPATLKDLDKRTTDEMSALLGAEQMAALLGPLWKSRQPRMCHYCNRMFSNKFNLKQHILNMHTQGREMQCEICNKKVKNKWYLRRHHVTHHNAPLKK